MRFYTRAPHSVDVTRAIPSAGPVRPRIKAKTQRHRQLTRKGPRPAAEILLPIILALAAKRGRMVRS